MLWSSEKFSGIFLIAAMFKNVKDFWLSDIASFPRRSESASLLWVHCVMVCYTAVVRKLYTRSPSVLPLPWLTRCSMWNFLLDKGVVHRIACWPLIPKIAGSLLAEAVRSFGRKNPQHAFLRKGSKAICPMSQTWGMSKNPIIYSGSRRL
jgi:hypothetical protein